ncbi:conserved exported hypothetical protein [Tenacibaculum litopenaei]|jgi:TonB-dependent SusC/RagA subfamily outer membrane receptor|uniref:TonB-dependent receptor plug domain-containing protein n=1 Tax=Tenacibaculum litopenaei TaxID=396016 RepID=UPI0038956C17
MKNNYFKILLFLFVVTMGFKATAQDKDNYLSIQVKDEKKRPVPGAIILFDDVRQKRWTNSKGIFKTKLQKVPKIIAAFSPKVGIQKVKYNGKKSIVIIIEKRNDSYTVNDANNKVASTAQFWNIYDYMRGRIPGVNIDSSNRITIRGYNTVNGSTTPLFILNGNAISEALFARIEPNTIKAIKVLKGTDSAIYGSRGANGVIVVDTF